MSNKIKKYRIALGQTPSIFQAGGVYYEETSATTFDLYIGDNNGDRRNLALSATQSSDVDIQIDAKIDQLNKQTPVVDIAERDALTPLEGDVVRAADATADPTVKSGGATYMYVGGAWIKTAEDESSDIDWSALEINWSQLIGAPTSTPAEIDGSVAASHSHANLTTLDKFSENVDGNVTFNGNSITGDSEWTLEEF